MIEAEIGKRIASLRTAKQETQQQLADSLGIKRETVKFWEGGNRQIKAGDIIKLAKHFGVSTDYLLGISDVKSPKTSLQAVCDTTGLSEESIISLQILKSFNNKELNSMLNSPNFRDVIFSMGNLCYYSEYLRDQMKYSGKQSFYNNIEKEDPLLSELYRKYRFYRFEAFSYFMKLLDCLYQYDETEKSYEILREELDTFKTRRKYDYLFPQNMDKHDAISMDGREDYLDDQGPENK